MFLHSETVGFLRVETASAFPFSFSDFAIIACYSVCAAHDRPSERKTTTHQKAQTQVQTWCIFKVALLYFSFPFIYIKVIQTELGGSFKSQSLHRPIERPSGLLTPVTDFLCLKTRVTSCQCQPRSLVSLSTCCMPGLKVITVKAESEAFTKITMTPGRRWWVLYQWNYIYIKQAIPRRIKKR